MATAAQVAIDVVDRHVGSGMADAGRDAQIMADRVEEAGRAADRARKSVDDIAGSADELGGKAGRATGALGALSSGAELGGPAFEKYGTALQSAALATDFVSGISDSLNLVLESTIVQNARARVATIAKAAAEKTAAVATKVMAAGQWALNAAMAANPIGLVVVAIAALVAGFVLAYKKSETFRTIVDAVAKAASTAIGWIVDKVEALVGWVKDKLPKAFGTAKDLVLGYLDLMTKPIQIVLDLIGKVIDAIGKIKFPKIPDINPFSRAGVPLTTTAGGAQMAGVPGGLARGGDTYQFNFNGFIGDRDALVAAFTRELDRTNRRNGR